MKRFLLVTVMLLSGIVFLKGQSSRSIMSKMKDKINSSECIDISFSFEFIKSTTEVTDVQAGEFIAQGELFKLITPSLTVFCDGSAKWIYDTSNEEVTIVPHDTQSRDITENPFGVLRTIDLNDYSFSAHPTETVYKGHSAYKITIKPVDKKANYISLQLQIEKTTLLPLSLRYENITGDSYFAEIISFKNITAKSSDFYSFSPQSSDSDIIITDLR